MGKGKKTFLTVIGTIVGLIVLLLIVVFFTTAGVKQAAEHVLDEFQQGHVESVFNDSLLAEEMSYDEFQQALLVGTPQDLTQAENVSWNGRGFKNSVKYISGTFTLPSGEEIDLTYSFVKKDGKFILAGIMPTDQ